jgi:hypothetical protein
VLTPDEPKAVVNESAEIPSNQGVYNAIYFRHRVLTGIGIGSGKIAAVCMTAPQIGNPKELDILHLGH